MFAFLPGPSDVLSLARHIDTVRHHGVPKDCVLELDLHSAPAETSGFDPLTIISGAGRPLTLQEAVTALHRAAEDRRVAGLIARIQLPSTAAGPLQELREAVAAFTAVKPSLAWAETYPGTLSYYLASAFGEVWMQPSGTVGLVGFATTALFLREALGKAGVEAQFIARGNTNLRRIFSRRTAIPTPTERPTPGCWTACTARYCRRWPNHAGSMPRLSTRWPTGRRCYGTTR